MGLNTDLLVSLLVALDTALVEGEVVAKQQQHKVPQDARLRCQQFEANEKEQSSTSSI